MSTTRGALEEESAWELIAAAYDGGKGIPLTEYDPDSETDMKELYEALNIEGVARKRLRTFIRHLRKTQEDDIVLSSPSKRPSPPPCVPVHR